MKNFIRFGLLVLLVLVVWFYVRRSRTTYNQEEKVLATMVEGNLESFDPAQAKDEYSIRQIAKVYEGLFEYHYLKRPFELVPNLAAAMPTISADGRIYTIKLKPGIKFHDNPCFKGGKGRELVAEDFVYTIKRVADPRMQSPWYSMLVGKIQGLDAWRNKYTDEIQVDYTETIEGLKALDKYTLQLTLNKPWPQLPYILAMSFCHAVPREAVAHYGQEFLNHPVGTGPFTLQEFNPQLNKLVFHKNPTFRDKYFPSEAAEAYQHLLSDAGKKLPLVDKVITYVIPEEQPRWLKFQKGVADVIDISVDNIALEVVQEGSLAPHLQQKGIQLFQAPKQAVGYIAFNNSLPLFKNNPKLRQAMALAFDREKYDELFHKGTAVLAQSIVPPDLAGHVKDYVSPYGTYNLAQAKHLLAEAGYPDGKGLPVITLDVSASTKMKQEGEFFQKCVKKLGIKVKVVPNIFPELLKKKAQKKTMMHSLAWIGDYPDAENFLWLLYKSDQINGIGVYFSDPSYNALYEKAIAMQPSPARTALYEQLYQLAAEKVPAIYRVHQLQSILYHGWVKNLCWSNFYASEQYINIDLEEKRALKDKF